MTFRSRSSSFVLFTALGFGLLSSACAKDERGEDVFSAGGSADGGLTLDGGDGVDGGGDGDGDGDGDGSGDGDGDGDGDGGPKFDVGGDGDGDGDDGSTMGGCEKADFLFVIDNSCSMEDEQVNLVNSFPGFIDTIRNTVQATDYHIMVVDSDAAGGGGGTITCSPAPSCCTNLCASNPTATCNGNPCTPPDPNAPCDAVLGAGKVKDENETTCFPDPPRYLTDGDAMLDSRFGCVAKVGSGGDGNEKVMEALVESVTSQVQTGECNEGFLRDDAILVATFISDEEDINKSVGNPMDWYNSLVAAKNGDPKAVVVLGLFGDNDQPNAVCTALSGNNGAEAAPRLRQFTQLWDNGVIGSVCAPDYTPFFSSAVSVIDFACEEFTPPAG